MASAPSQVIPMVARWASASAASSAGNVQKAAGSSLWSNSVGSTRQRMNSELLEGPRISPPSFMRQRHRMPSLSSQNEASIRSLRHPSTLTPPPTTTSRLFSASALKWRHSLCASPTTSFVGFGQQRTLFGSSRTSSSNSSHLANLELAANNNPNSPTAQNAFYQALLRQNMPEIIVERYHTGRFASNAAVDSVYNRALERIGAQEVGSTGIGSLAGKTPGGQSNHLSSEQLQAVGQALAARQRGVNASITSSRGTGAKHEPLHVVVEETWRNTVFNWVTKIIWYLFVFYMFNVFVTLAIDFFSFARKISPSTKAEAKPELQNVRFSDVHGCDEAKEELQELVEFLKAPEKFGTLGGKLPKGVLLSGPPGTGKTLLARAVAGEAGVPFFYMSGSEFDEMFVGVGAKRVRELFSAARAKSPAIIFIDELDAVGGKRNEREPGYAKQTLNQLLTELDGFDQSSGVILIGATNFPQALDKALTRPGRFDRNVAVPLPDVRGRIAILKHHLKNVKTDASVDAAIIARGCPGFSGAELENVVNQAAVRASKNKSLKVTESDLVWAKDKVMLGAERRSAVIQEKDKLMTAYHEAGHALVGMLTDAATPLYKATIMPRGNALGITHFLPELDEVSRSKRQLMAQIDVSMGGKVAEELVYGPDYVTTGASSDISSATNVAYHMVTQAGMSDLLGNIDLQGNYSKLSSETKQQIEREVRRLVEEGHSRARKLLTENRTGLDRLAKALVEYETLDKIEIEKVVRGESLQGRVKADLNAPIKIPDGPPPNPTISIPPEAVGLPGLGTSSGGAETGQSKNASNT